MGARGFEASEYEARLARAQELMNAHQIDALFLTSEADFRYFTGFLTRFWESPTRPWYLIVPATGAPLAVIPLIGEALFTRQSNCEYVGWRAPDYDDDGVSLLVKSFQERFSPRARIGVPSGIETHLRMPLLDFERVQREADVEFLEDFEIMKSMRMIKSDAEIQKIKTACEIADRAFGRVHEIAHIGVPLSEIFRRFQMLCLEEGADYVPYLAGAADQNGYDDVISPASDRPLEMGDVLMLDTGLVWDGYFCDFDRNFAIGKPSEAVIDGHQKLVEATRSAFEKARVGVPMSELFDAANQVVSPGTQGNDAGRFGHSFGMQLTEFPSLIPHDHTACAEGMVLTIEPSIALDGGKILVHEENIVVTKSGANWLSNPYKELVAL